MRSEMYLSYLSGVIISVHLSKCFLMLARMHIGKLHCRAGEKTDPKEFTTVALSLFLTQIMVQSNVETRSMFTLYLLVKNSLFTY